MNGQGETGWGRIWRFGLRSGLAALRQGRFGLGLRALLNPVRSGFARYFEIPYVANALKARPGEKVLDLASPKHAALYLGAAGARVTALDLMASFVPEYEAYGRALGLETVSWEVKDATRLDYPAASFDHAYSISAIEHFTGDGDTAALRSVARLLRPGGRLALTVPGGAAAREIRLAGDVYSRRYEGQPLFFYRVYDEESLQRRLIAPAAGLREVDRTFWRARWDPDAWWNVLPRPLHMGLNWAGPLWARLAYARARDWGRDGEGICCLTLQKD